MFNCVRLLGRLGAFVGHESFKTENGACPSSATNPWPSSVDISDKQMIVGGWSFFLQHQGVSVMIRNNANRHDGNCFRFSILARHTGWLRAVHSIAS